MRRILLGLVVGGSLTAGVGDAAAYERSITPEAGAPMEWNTRRIPYWINEAGSDDMDFETLQDQVRLSFDPWAEEPCAVLDFVYRGTTAYGADPHTEIGYDDYNVIVFREENDRGENDRWLYDSDIIAVTTVSFCEGVGGACDLAGEILDADIEVNGFDFRFSTGDVTPRTRFDLRNTLTHEVGHLLGFDHTGIAEATMFASAPPGENAKRSLHSDDIDALCDVYTTIYSERNPDDPDGCAATPGDGPIPGPGWLALVVGGLLLGARRRR